MTKAKLDIDWVIKKYMPFFKEYGMEEQNIREYYKTWSKLRPPLIKDYVWFIFQTLLFESAKQSKSESELYQHQININTEMLYFRRTVENAKENGILQTILEFKIKKTVLDTDFPLKIIIASKHCCEYCDSLNNSTYSVEDVLENKYLGSSKCTNSKGCTCTYAFLPIR